MHNFELTAQVKLNLSLQRYESRFKTYILYKNLGQGSES